MDDRYDRQRRLAEVGPEGQRAIEASCARLPAGPAATVALSYLVRAGVSRASIERAASEPFTHAAAFRFAAPRAVAEGADCALRQLKAALFPERLPQ